MDTIKNILQLWHFYWRTEKKIYLRLFFMFWAIFLVKIAVIDFIFMHGDSEIYAWTHNTLHTYICMGGILITVSRLFDAIHQKQRAIDFLSLPASNGEKFFSRYLLGIMGVPLLVNLSLLAAACVVTLVLNSIDVLLSHQPSGWETIFNYYYDPYSWVGFRDVLRGYYPVSTFIVVSIWNYIVLLAFISFFIWFGTAFRKAGWVYAFIAIFVTAALLVFFLEVTGTGNQPTPRIAISIFKYGSILFTILYTYLAYHSFCRAQVVTHKFFTL